MTNVPKPTKGTPEQEKAASDGVLKLRELAADETKSGEELRQGLADVLAGIDPLILAQAGIC